MNIITMLFKNPACHLAAWMGAHPINEKIDIAPYLIEGELDYKKAPHLSASICNHKVECVQKLPLKRAVILNSSICQTVYEKTSRPTSLYLIDERGIVFPKNERVSALLKHEIAAAPKVWKLRYALQLTAIVALSLLAYPLIGRITPQKIQLQIALKIGQAALVALACLGCWRGYQFFRMRMPSMQTPGDWALQLRCYGYTYPSLIHHYAGFGKFMHGQEMQKLAPYTV